MNDRYKTIDAQATGIYREKGSKFLSFAYPVASENEIKLIIAQLKKEYFDARHHCYAYRLGVNGEIFRANDGGEPSGTAGRPIYGQILSYDITNILIVVVRYFGGIKLGTSGLINAYKTAAIDALKNSKTVERTERQTVTLRFAYNAMNDIMKIVKDEKIEITEQITELDCHMKLKIDKSKIQPVLEKLSKTASVITQN
ncbi:MAG: YigZ family protein [Prevotellaceae bacterium]|nr:YigZ family protein [Prevotellaceae bacterium]